MNNPKFTRVPGNSNPPSQLADKLKAALSGNRTAAPSAMKTSDLDLGSEFDAAPPVRSAAVAQAEKAFSAPEELVAYEEPQEAEQETPAEDEDVVDLPAALVIPENAGEPFTLELFSRNCLKCSSMGTGETLFTTCHVDNGNTLCPARNLVVKFVGRVRQAALRLKNAIDAGNRDRVASLMRKIAENEDPNFSADVLEEYQKLIKG